MHEGDAPAPGTILSGEVYPTSESRKVVAIEEILEVGMYESQRIVQVLGSRQPDKLKIGERPMITARNYPAKGVLGAGGGGTAIASCVDALKRCAETPSRPGVNGFLGTADIIGDLTLLRVLGGELVYDSMNRVGPQKAGFEMDGQFSCYDPAGIVAAHLDGGKTLTRINLTGSATVDTLKTTADVVSAMSQRHLVVMIRPFMSSWVGSSIVNGLTPEAAIKSMATASGLGRSSVYTWLKPPCADSIERVMEASTLPSLILSSEISKDTNAVLEKWQIVLQQPNVFSLVIGHFLLFPTNNDVAKAVSSTVGLL